ncbi:MAG: fused DSP-PTPase phosphatase/NAD kinase-like protein [Gemmatimonadales bacterium]
MSQLLDAARKGGIVNAAEPLPGVVTGGQPTADQLAALKDAGCEVVLDLREPMEARPLDEPRAVRALGLEYINVPIAGTALNDQTMERVRNTLRDLSARGRKVLCHCGSGNRPAASLIPHFILEKGMSEEDAIDAAMVLGLRRAELVEWAVGYVRRNGR